jgi:hypothetical protein
MTFARHMAIYGFDVTEAQRSEILALLQVATAMDRHQHPDSDLEMLQLLAVQSFSLGKVEDCMAIWRAKGASFDAYCTIDAQLMCGAGLVPTLQHLQSLAATDAEAALALQHLRQREDAGDFERFSRDIVLASWHKHFVACLVHGTDDSPDQVKTLPPDQTTL